jgi:hypothetical protein
MLLKTENFSERKEIEVNSITKREWMNPYFLTQPKSGWKIPFAPRILFETLNFYSHRVREPPRMSMDSTVQHQQPSHGYSTSNRQYLHKRSNFLQIYAKYSRIVWRERRTPSVKRSWNPTRDLQGTRTQPTY